jgi:hypothetical protein
VAAVLANDQHVLAGLELLEQVREKVVPRCRNTVGVSSSVPLLATRKAKNSTVHSKTTRRDTRAKGRFDRALLKEGPARKLEAGTEKTHRNIFGVECNCRRVSGNVACLCSNQLLMGSGRTGMGDGFGWIQ